jgi:hypothetical protein
MERMRSSELLEARVVDRDGHEIGNVHDIRMTKDGPSQGMFGRGYRVRALIVGPAALGARLGFDRRTTKGPRALKILFRLLRKRSWVVDWSLIESRSSAEIRIRATQEELPHVTGR